MLLSSLVFSRAARAKQLEAKDARTRFTNDIIQNIHSIKLFAWEPSFSRELFTLRNSKELKYLHRRGIFIAASDGLAAMTPFFVSFVSFASFAIFSGRPLTPDLAFPALAIFSLLETPIAVLPYLVSLMIDSQVSSTRLNEFLRASELKVDNVVANDQTGSDVAISIVDGDFSWALSSSVPTLSGISLQVKPGELCAILGRVGAGKSSLLSAILGEMNKIDGSVHIAGSIAYTSQIPFLVGGTVRQNILFGKDFEQGWYDTVVEACALSPDFRMLNAGDSTEVGEKGVQLSGGQKARISLARAVYSKADIYLLDDPLSAVDAHVGHHIFDKVFYHLQLGSLPPTPFNTATLLTPWSCYGGE